MHTQSRYMRFLTVKNANNHVHAASFQVNKNIPYASDEGKEKERILYCRVLLADIRILVP